MRNVLKNTVLVSLSGILAFLAFPPFEFSFLAWICLVPLFWAIKDANSWHAFLYSFLAGIVFFGCALYWLMNVTILGMIVVMFILASYYGVFGAAAAYVMRYPINLFAIPFIWVVIEYIRGHFLMGFPWALLGYTQYRNISIIQMADLTGTYGISFLVVIINIAVFCIFLRFKKVVSYIVVGLLFWATAYGYGLYRLDNCKLLPGGKVSVVQGNVSTHDKWNSSLAGKIIEKYSVLTRDAARDNPDMIVWPETSYPYLLEDWKTSAKEISDLGSSLETSILAGASSSSGDKVYNSAVLFDAHGNFVDIYHKIHLVPFGEYIPFRKYLSFLQRYINKPIGSFDKGSSYTLFPMRVRTTSIRADGARLSQIDFYKFGTLICFEDIFPSLARAFVLEGAHFLVSITNDAWFGRSAAPRQHFAASVLRAVENRVPVVRAANTGISGFIDPTGRIGSLVKLEGEEIFIQGIATGDVNMYTKRSFYTLHGDVFVYFCIFMSVLLYFYRGKNI